MHIGTKIKKLRELRNFTQSYMAAMLNITQSTYCRYENNELDFSESMLERLSPILGISKAAIVCFEENRLFEYIEMMTQCKQIHTSKEIELYEELILALKNENRNLSAYIQDIRRFTNIEEDNIG